jgi:hypothetical protein
MRKARWTKAKERLAEMIEESIDERIEEITEHCGKHHLNYSLEFVIWKTGEDPPKLGSEP